MMPRGIIGTLQQWWTPWRAQRIPAKSEPPPASAQTNPAE
jgi:urea transport system permease protein